MNKLKYDDLKERVQKYTSGKLPGQPLSMHMGTSYLINDLLRGLVELKQVLSRLGYTMEGEPESPRSQNGCDDVLPVLKPGMITGTYGPEGRFEKTAILVKQLPRDTAIFEDEFIGATLERWEVKIPGYPDQTFARWIDRREVVLGDNGDDHG